MRPSARATAEVMAQVLRTTASLAFTDGLNPAQWAALRYFAQANASARNVVAFARHHGTTKGTASQTIAALLKKDLLERHPSETDRRSIRLTLTAQGRSMLANDPLNELVAAIDGLAPAQHGALAAGLDELLRSLLSRRAEGGARAGDSLGSSHNADRNGAAAD
ncbi:MarR family transcriptional regulator [Azospirillum sp. YIM DDC1]|uniref:MarR family transcriptional regulator n=1 Tax=Azospirillum aestuarii TaxID=2802052 RepID=A0ABS1I0D9_9PROT|nr:MarR family transcriptional regulator [Azospirillum aestuarii]MBK3776248.1 MarR family transcriptional regulator [Azospirillum brasilense]MBK4720532.1 MarR family transcriptional regulator [Azospirillum aestuarii]TWA82249.1 DNA-binding MarR family transcriptional regulator [Azospirillum brasilense]